MRLLFFLLLALMSIQVSAQDGNIFDNFVEFQLGHEYTNENYKCAIKNGSTYDTILVSRYNEQPNRFNITIKNIKNINATRDEDGNYILPIPIYEQLRFRLVGYHVAKPPMFAGEQGTVGGMELQFRNEDGDYNYVTCYETYKTEVGEIITKLNTAVKEEDRSINNKSNPNPAQYVKDNSDNSIKN
jgi:hypothetical protein